MAFVNPKREERIKHYFRKFNNWDLREDIEYDLKKILGVATSNTQTTTGKQTTNNYLNTPHY